MHPSALSPETQPDGRNSWEKANEMIGMALQTGKHRFEWIHRRLDGETFPAEVALTAIMMEEMPLVHAVVRDISDRKKMEAEQRRLQENMIRVQAEMLAELSTPLIPISDQIVVMPLIGGLDSQRAQQVLSSLLTGIELSRAQVAILDITGVPIIDTHVANTLLQAAQAVALLGAQLVLTGIRPEVAQTLVGLGVNLNGMMTCANLQAGIAYAMSSHTDGFRLGRE
jgi:rsbT co-antagonist protein RsbR